MMNDTILTIVNAVIAKAPEWVRNDLASKDARARVRAEDAVAAMIASALSAGPAAPAPMPRDPIGRGARAA